MKTEIKLYNVGDKVWWARCGQNQVQRTCIVCYGKKEVTLILGNGEEMVLPCSYCALGFDSSRGFTQEYEFTAEPQLITITSYCSEMTCSGEKREYQHGMYSLYPEQICETQQEAVDKCAKEIEEKEAEQQRRAGCTKSNKTKHFSWDAGYHMKQVTDLERQIEWHKANAQLCRERKQKKSAGSAC